MTYSLKTLKNENVVDLAWGIVVRYVHWNGEGRKLITNIVCRTIDDEVWKLQDGYGSPGWTPSQGWDWSGIRDSSKNAILRIAAKILEILADDLDTGVDS